RNQRGEVPGEPSHTNPIMVVVTWGRPANALATSFVRLPVIDIAGHNRPPRSMPIFIGDNLFRRAIRVVDLKLGKQRQPISVDVAPPTIEAESPPVPPIAQGSADGIMPFMQQTRYIERLISQT